MEWPLVPLACIDDAVAFVEEHDADYHAEPRVDEPLSAGREQQPR